MVQTKYTKPGTTPKKSDEELLKEPESQFPLGKNNFIGMGISALLIIVGFLLMIGSGSTTEAFNPDIFSPRRIVVGPTIAFVGFITLGISIILRPKGK